MITIDRLPNDLNVDSRIEDKIIDVYGTCPYCNHTYKEIKKDSYTLKYVEYKRSDIVRMGSLSKNGLFKEKYPWHVMKFKCYGCGMEWSSPEYPRGLCESKKIKDTIFNSWQNGINTGMNTLLLTVLNGDKKNDNATIGYNPSPPFS